MDLGDGTHLTYCTNIHPGETWSEVREAIVRHVTAVKAKVCPEHPFGVGLRLSHRAASELAAPAAERDLVQLLDREGLYVFTINGFPYGPFHGRPVKERVYAPDWRDPERLAYTERLAQLLARLLPEGQVGSVSSVPGAFRPHVQSEDDELAMADNVLRCVASLHRLHQESGRVVALALEPEPACYLETTEDAIAFFTRFLQSERGLARLGELTGLARPAAEEALHRHAGLCLDACHAAVEFEDPATSLARLAEAGIEIKKLQLSAGLRVERVDEAMRRALVPYLDDVYLHQVVQRRGESWQHFVDLHEALAEETRADGAEWRVHFHVPVFLPRLRHFGNTQDFLRRLLALQKQQRASAHLEVETYTWNVLPDEVRSSDVTDAIARELRFCLDELRA